MESQEIMSTPYCDDKSMSKSWPFLEWTQYNERAAKEAGRPVRMAHKLKKWYEEAGFVDVQEKVIKLPMNPWPKDKKLKELGRMSEKNILAGLSAFSLAHFSRVFGWSKTEIEVSNLPLKPISLFTNRFRFILSTSANVYQTATSMHITTFTWFGERNR